jgi:glycosyltransferase involved in cell wall biosynthesis
MPMTANKNQRPLGFLRGIAMRLWYNKHRYQINFSSAGGEQEFLNYYRLSLDTAVLPSGITLSKERSSRRASADALNDPWLRENTTGSSPRISVIGAVCQFVPQKNLHLLIDAWEWAAVNGAPSRLLLIGDGPQRQEIEARLATTSKEFWHITGWGEKYTDYMAQLDIFMMPSVFEGLPLAFVEAVAMGIPSIVSNFNGATDVAAQSGWVEIVDPLGVEALGRAIAREVQNLRAIVPESDRQRFIEYFSPARMAADFLKIIEPAPTT